MFPIITAIAPIKHGEIDSLKCIVSQRAVSGFTAHGFITVVRKGTLHCWKGVMPSGAHCKGIMAFPPLHFDFSAVRFNYVLIPRDRAGTSALILDLDCIFLTMFLFEDTLDSVCFA